ncbi:MAG: hypothetical protein ACP5MD_12850, partial [Verrucomicrobiia bacterium]
MPVSSRLKGGTLTAAGMASPKVRDNRSLLEFRVYAGIGKLSVTGSARRGRRAECISGDANRVDPNKVPGSQFGFCPLIVGWRANRPLFRSAVAEVGAGTPQMPTWGQTRCSRIRTKRQQAA